MAKSVPPGNFDIKLKFGAGINSRGSPDEIDIAECAAGQNFRLDHSNTSLRPRKPIDMEGTAPNAGRINGFAQLRKSDGSITTLVQAAGKVYSWDGGGGWVDTGVSVSSNARLRGDPKKAYWPLGSEKVIIADLARVEPVMEWDGTTLSNMTHNLAGDFKAKYVYVVGERAYYANVESNSTVTSHMIVGSELSDYASLSTSDRPSSALGAADPFFLLTPDLKSVNGIERAFGVTFVSSDLGSMFKLTGSDSTDFAIDEFYQGSQASGDEAMVFVGNDVFYGRIGRIESMVATDQFGDVETEDPSVDIQDQTESLKNWTALYNPRYQLVYMFDDGLGTVYVFYKPGAEQDTNLSKWTKYTTEHAFNFQVTAAMTLFNPDTGLEDVYMGDASGNIYRLEGDSTTGDAGSANIKVSRTSRIFVPDLDQHEYEIEGFVTFLKEDAASVTITMQYQGVNVFDRAIGPISLPAPTGDSYFGGSAYFGGDFYFGSSGRGKYTRKRFSAGHGSNYVQIKTDLEGTADFAVQEVLIRGRTSTQPR